MMKVDIEPGANSGHIRVCGRIGGEWVSELERAWQALISLPGQSKQIEVDLRGVTFIDEAGRALIERMYMGGACFQTSGVVIKKLVDEITEEAQGSVGPHCNESNVNQKTGDQPERMKKQ